MASIEPRTIRLEASTATIRHATAADAEGVVALYRAAALETSFLSREPDEYDRPPEAQAAVLRAKLASPCDLFLVAETATRVIGIAELQGSPLRRFAHGATLGIAVLREYWRHGVGRALTQALLDWADARGLVRVALEVVDANAPAIRMYESLGFAVEGRLCARRKHADAYVDNLHMARVRFPEPDDSSAGGN